MGELPLVGGDRLTEHMETSLLTALVEAQEAYVDSAETYVTVRVRDDILSGFPVH